MRFQITDETGNLRFGDISGVDLVACMVPAPEVTMDPPVPTVSRHTDSSGCQAGKCGCRMIQPVPRRNRVSDQMSQLTAL